MKNANYLTIIINNNNTASVVKLKYFSFSGEAGRIRNNVEFNCMLLCSQAVIRMPQIY